jgi:hypothetical protein
MSLLVFVLLSGLLPNSSPTSAPRFSQYPATEGLRGQMMLPRITDAEEREFRTVLRQAVTKGYEVVDGGTEHERRGPNFGGHYVLVQWGCGSNCMEAALIDANTGHVLQLPQIPGSEVSGFEIATGSVDLRTLQFRTDSLLLGIPYVGDSQTYYYVLDRGHWRFLMKVPTPQD